jgi:uncharacterized protein YwqG
MFDFLKHFFGDGKNAEVSQPKTVKPMLPEDQLDDFKTWYLAQKKPAVALVPDPTGEIRTTGSRLGGPAWLADGESWPVDKHGVPLEFLCQLDCADCQSLEGYPGEGVFQFFIGRDDLYGADFDNLLNGSYLVRLCSVATKGALIEPPPLKEVGEISFSDYSPFMNGSHRTNGIALRAVPFEDRIDQSIKDAEARIMDLYKVYDISALEAFVESDDLQRPMQHHTGGFPAFTQSDVRYIDAFSGYDHVLLRITSDDTIMWGDVGEAVFLMPSEDLHKGDFSRVAYNWDCS